ncbi:flagellar hook-length control protein FliK [Salicibibacter cibarius]|uniref:Flagellar hook-length control protein FliK n=1 Tax=Salicibibacter cibarius TaxID=2743000 RepID=A0A7T6Z3V0_9BACI|nr:flagellar hook-length control protein FliK [Salicibibacter cibarius]QQK76375.1 flagellar hook-length control protein FliK [Salicibibacter cibarius]
MIPAGLQSFSFHEGVSGFVPASMEGLGENLEQTFAQQLAHFQEKNEAFSQEEGSLTSQDMLEKTVNKDLPDIEAILELFYDWVRSFPEAESFFEDIDWENVMMIAEEALSENEGEDFLSFDFEQIAAFIIDAGLPIPEMLETIFLDSEKGPGENEEAFAFAEELKEANLPPLIALIAFVAEEGENAKPIREQLAQYAQQLYSSPGREIGTQNYGDASGHVKESRKTTEVAPRFYRFEPSNAAVKMEMILPKLNHGTPPPAAFVFNETMTMQALNQGEQLNIHIGDQKTEHARAMAFMKQFQQALSKGHLRSDGEGRQQLTIKLHPESLGRLDVQITRDNGVLQARLVTTTALARELVESQLPNLRHAFHQQQLPVERIVVDEARTEVADERREGKHSADEDASAYEEESDEDRDGKHLPSFEEWLQTTLNQEE